MNSRSKEVDYQIETQKTNLKQASSSTIAALDGKNPISSQLHRNKVTQKRRKPKTQDSPLHKRNIRGWSLLVRIAINLRDYQPSHCGQCDHKNCQSTCGCWSFRPEQCTWVQCGCNCKKCSDANLAFNMNELQFLRSIQIESRNHELSHPRRKKRDPTPNPNYEWCVLQVLKLQRLRSKYVRFIQQSEEALETQAKIYFKSQMRWRWLPLLKQSICEGHEHYTKPQFKNKKKMI